MIPSNSRRGAALALLLLLMAALSALGFGALTLARRQATAARASGSVLQASLAAESGVAGLPASWPEAADSLPRGESLSLVGELGETGRYAIFLRRIAGELFLAESTGWHIGTTARIRAWAAVWRLDPLARVATAAAVVVHGDGLRIEGSGRVELATVTSPDLVDACAPWAAGIDRLFPGAWLRRDAPLERPASTAWSPEGELVPFEPVPDPPERPGLGMLSLDSLLAGSVPGEDPLEQPDPGCDDSAEGAAVCPSRVLVRVPAGSSVSRGSVRGVVVSDADLTFGGDAAVQGWVVVGGDLTLRDSARIRGFVRAGGRVLVSGNARIDGDPCAAAVALDDPWLRRARIVPPGSGLGPPG